MGLCKCLFFKNMSMTHQKTEKIFFESLLKRYECLYVARVVLVDIFKGGRKPNSVKVS